jgi:hypothetical protein
MGFVDENQIDFRPSAPGERLNAANLNWRIAISARVNALQDAEGMNACGLEGADRLIYQRQRGNDEGNALALGEGAMNDFLGDPSLACAGRHLKHRPAPARHQRAAQFF